MERRPTQATAIDMATLEKISFTIAQTAEQEVLKTVRIGYGYTLNRSDDPPGTDSVYTMSIDILGDDVAADDELAMGVDEHDIECAPGAKATHERDLIVAQSLLNEDFGTDEIKLRIRATDVQGNPISVMTSVIRGNF